MARSGSNDGDEASALVAAARGIEAEVRRFEQLTERAVRGGLASEKHIEAAERATREAATHHAQFGEHLRALVAAVEIARTKQQQSADALNARSEAVAARRAELVALRERFGVLRTEAQEVSALLQQVNALRGRTDDASRAEMLGVVEAARERMDGAVEQARAIVDATRDAGFEDLERDGETFRQQLLASRNGLKLLTEQVVARTVGTVKN